jgi:hypothetical protein
VLRVEMERRDANGTLVAHENRYFVSSLPRSRLTVDQWLLLVRSHWGVETSHQILDVSFYEDHHPWIEQNPRATVVLMVLRRIAYTLLALWRGVTLLCGATHPALACRHARHRAGLPHGYSRAARRPTPPPIAQSPSVAVTQASRRHAL